MWNIITGMCLAYGNETICRKRTEITLKLFPRNNHRKPCRAMIVYIMKKGYGH